MCFAKKHHSVWWLSSLIYKVEDKVRFHFPSLHGGNTVLLILINIVLLILIWILAFQHWNEVLCLNWALLGFPRIAIIPCCQVLSQISPPLANKHVYTFPSRTKLKKGKKTVAKMTSMHRHKMTDERVYTSGAPNGSFRGISVRWGLNRLRYSDLVAVKARDFYCVLEG